MFLEQNNKLEYLDLVRKIGSRVDVFAVRQKEALGLGHAISCAKPFIQPGENFAVLLADDLVINKVPVTKQLMDVSEKLGNKATIGVMEVPKEQTNKYGIIAGFPQDSDSNVLKMTGMIEKPAPEEAPSCLRSRSLHSVL